MVGGYFWYFVGMTACIVFLTRFLVLYFYLWCHVDLSHFAWTPYFTSWSNMYIYIYIYIIDMFLSSTNLYKSLFFSQLLFWKGGLFFSLTWYLARTTDEIEHLLCFSSNVEFLGVLSSNFEIFWSVQRSPTHDQLGTVSS